MKINEALLREAIVTQLRSIPSAQLRKHNPEVTKYVNERREGLFEQLGTFTNTRDELVAAHYDDDSITTILDGIENIVTEHLLKQESLLNDAERYSYTHVSPEVLIRQITPALTRDISECAEMVNTYFNETVNNLKTRYGVDLNER